MAPPSKKRPASLWRAAFRWVRITFLFAIFLVVCAGAYFHLVGLPDFLKRPLLNHLRERGFEVQFTSARLGWGPDVVVENASFHRPDHPLSPQLAAGRTQIFLNLPGLLHRRVRVDSLRISQGGLRLPLGASNSDFLSVNNVFLDLDLLPNDTIRLQRGLATFHGIQFSLQGTVTNYTAARDWNLWTTAARAASHPASAGGLPAAENSLRQFAATLDKVHFAVPPQIVVHLQADGHDPDSLWTELTLEAGGVQTPWGEAKGLKLAAVVSKPMNPGSEPFLKTRFSADEVTTPQARGHSLYLTADVASAAGSNLTAAVNLAVTGFEAGEKTTAETNTFRAGNLQWVGSVTLRRGPLAIVAATGKVEAMRVQTKWGSTESATFTEAITAVNGSPVAAAAGGLWSKFNAWAVDWQGDLSQIVTPKIRANRLRSSGRWRAPELVVSNFDATLYGGQISWNSRLDVGSRQLAANANFDFDPRELVQYLTPAAQKWVAQVESGGPPKVSAGIKLTLPPWTNRSPDWWSEVLPTLQIAGDFSTGWVSFRHLNVNSAQSHFTYSNSVWNLPRLHAVRSDGDLDLDFTGSDQTGDFSFVIDSRLNPEFVRPLVPQRQQTLLDEVSFTQPPQIHAEIRGNWGDAAKTAVRAHVTATNFTARGEKVGSLDAAVQYTNLWLRGTDAQVFMDGGTLAVSSVEADLAAKKISASNVVSTLDIGVVIRMLGRVAPPWLKEITFDTPPTVHLSGSFVPGDDAGTDLHFAVAGQNCHFSHALADHVSGQVNWTARSVAVTNVQAGLYAGTMTAWGVFDYAPKQGTGFRGDFSLAKIQLPQLVRGWSDKSNHLEGVLDGRLSITDGNSSDRKSWQASGHVFIHQALLWDIKTFGILSPLLNAIVPGSGNSRAYQASADFVVTNALLATDNLEIRSTGFRLLYRGTLSADKKLDARAEAQVLRDTPLFGHWLSWAFAPLSKLFEYKIGGTLNAPTYKPLYVPKVLLLMLRPFHTLKGFLPPSENTTSPDALKTPNSK